MVNSEAGFIVFFLAALLLAVVLYHVNYIALFVILGLLSFFYEMNKNK